MYVLEWHHASNNFHVQPLARALDSNRYAFAENRAAAYIAIGLGTHDEMTALADELRPVMRAREVASSRHKVASSGLHASEGRDG